MTDWMNPQSKAVAADMVRAALRANNMNAGAEAAAVVVVLLCREMARDDDISADDLVLALMGHAAALVAGHGRPLLTVLQGGKGNDDGT